MSGLERKRSSTKCSKCKLASKKIIEWDNRNVETSLVASSGTCDVLIILEMPEYETFLNKFINILHKFDIKNYEIHVGLKCKSKSYELPSPIYKIYENCNCIQEKEHYKAVLTVGRGLFAITNSNDIQDWNEFAEFQFNPTYFYTPYTWKNKIRVYPLPSIFSWINSDNFQKFYVKKQLKFLKNHLKNYDIEKFNFIKPLYKYIDDPNQFLNDRMDEKIVAWDIETSHLDFFALDFKIRSIQMCFDNITGYYLPYERINKRLLNKFFINKEQFGANLKFDYKALFFDGVRNMKIDEDIIILFHLLDTNRVKSGLKTVSWFYGMGGYDKKLDSYVEKYKIKNYDKIPDNIMIPYSCLDAVSTYRATQEALSRAKLQPFIYKAYKKYVIPVIPYFMKMEINGMKIDKRYLNTLNKDLIEKLAILEKELKEYFGDNIEISSTEQLGKAIEAKGWTESAYSKKGIYNTGNIFLKQWKKENVSYSHIAELLLQWRASDKLRTTFVGEDKSKEKSNNFVKPSVRKKEKKNKIEGITKFIKNDGYIHSTINPARTNSWRSNSTSPNILNFPHHGGEGKKFRPVITTPSDDYYIMEVDYSGFQLRIASIFSDDPVMKKVFLSDFPDLHSITSHSVFFNNKEIYELEMGDLSIKKYIEGEKIQIKKDGSDKIILVPVENLKEGDSIILISTKNLKEENIIVKKIIKRIITEEDVVSLRGKTPFKEYRFRAKGVNFGFIFGRSAFGFQPDLEEAWTDEEIDLYISENNLELEMNRYNKLDPYLTVSSEFRRRYFKKYPELMPWIKDCHTKAKEQGYVECPQGARRHLPWMKYAGIDADKSLYSNYKNIAVNSPVQGMEACLLYEAMIKIDKEMVANNMKSIPINSVYDSLVFYVHKDEVKELSLLCKKYMEITDKWDIPILVDVEFGNIWGFSSEIDFDNIDESIKNIKLESIN